MQILWILAYCCSVSQHVIGGPVLLFANRRDVQLIDSDRHNVTVVVNGLEDATAVDYDYYKKYIFWTEVAWEKIKRTSIDTKKVSVVVKADIVAPDGLACDWLASKLYWTDSETNRIETSHYDGSHRKVLYWSDLDQPRAIAVDPYHGYVYWTDWGEVPKIERGGMDGDQSSRSVIINENIYWPNGLALDYDESRIYWADAKLSYIHCSDLDGSNRRTVIKGNLDHPFALTLFKDEIFWTDWESRAIHKCNKVTGKDRTVVKGDIFSPMDIHVYSRERQKPGRNPCGTNNGGCSHLCLMSASLPLKYRCACPTGVRLLPDTKTCADGPDNILLLARRTDLRRISLDMPDYTDMVLQLDSIKHAIALDFDPVDKFVYWTDDGLKTIKRAHLDGSDEEVIQEAEVSHPDGIAVDWIGRNLYWTDTGTNRIEVARLNGSSRRVLISEGLDEPRAITLDPVRGVMYWADWGKAPKIERANLDGTNRVVLISGPSLGWPNGLAIDRDNQKLYWGDAKKDKIEVAQLDGDRVKNRMVLVTKELPHIFGFSLLGNYIYWTDWQRRSIERVNLTGGEREVIVDQLPDLMGLKAVNLRMTKGTNKCAHHNGHCSHLCLNRPPPMGMICACPMGMDLTRDNRTCVVPDSLLLFAELKSIRRISIDLNYNAVKIPIAGLKHVLAMDYHLKGDRLYWSDFKSKTLNRAFMNGSYSTPVIRTGIEYPEGIAVDWIAGNIYWCDIGAHRIEVARLNGLSRRVVVWKDLENPRIIALDPSNGYFYWSSWGDVSLIERAALDGTSRQVIISKVGRVNGLTIDFVERRLFWTDFDKRNIETSDMNGHHRRVLINTQGRTPFCLSLYGDHIFWSEWTDITNQSITRANKTTGRDRKVIAENLDNVMAIKIYHRSRQSGINSCALTNGGCQHLCLARSNHLPTEENYRCSCPTHFRLNDDLRTCSPPRRFILFSRKTSISRALYDPKAGPDITLPIAGLRNIGAIEYDPVDRYIYWIDIRTKSIRKALENGTKIRTVVTNTNNVPHDLSLDPYSRHIYWSCEQTNTIIVTRFDGIEVGAIVGDDSQRPRLIVVYPEKGLMFWSNDMSTPRIERAAMDGTERVVLFSTGIKKIGALAIDRYSDFLYWTDVTLKRIERSDLAGGNREVLVDQGVRNPRGVAVSRSFVFWIDRDQNLIERVNKRNGSARVVIGARLKHLSGVYAAEGLGRSQLSGHPCRAKNGGCSHVCVAKDDRTARCSCPIGLVLSKNLRSCTDPPTCPSDHFTCSAGTCIPQLWRCDGFNECDDRSDELGCPVCSGARFSCGDGVCIPESKVCNGIADCHHGNDEEDCCGPDEVKCEHSERCVAKGANCDDVVDECAETDEGCRTESTRGSDSHASDGAPSVHVTVVVIICAVVVIVVVFVLYVCCKKTPPSNTVVYYDPVATAKFSTHSHEEYVALPQALSKSALSTSNSIAYDRNHVTGASSSCSTVTRYPLETLNPPPSPVTVRSQFTGGNQSLSSTTSVSLPPRTRNHHRRRYAPPPTTPCSTDLCDDSEPCATRRHRYLPYDSAPWPPPPTPHYLSDEPSCPPSPGTVRSFYNPYPPPPSPVANSDC